MSGGAATRAGRSLAVRDPATGTELDRVPVMDAAGVRALVDRARAAQPQWAARPARERARALQRFRGVLADHAHELAELSSRETGKLVYEALMVDVLVTCDVARWYARRAPAVLGRRRVSAGWLLTKRAYTVREPYGVVAVIGPWNFPILNTMRAVLAALVAGNAVVLKPSEMTPLTALRLAELAERSGLPPDLLLVATGDGSTGAALVDAPVDKIAFTGSVETGRAVARRAAERLVPVALELGGKDAAIVLADADLERAARSVVAGAFWNAGQICTSIERVYVEAPVHDRFVDRVRAQARALRTGPPDGADTDVGAVVTDVQIERIERQVADAVERGARVVAGGQRAPGPGRFYPPTVLTDVDHGMDVMREETFGPVLPIMKVSGADEAVRLANDSPYALGAAVWGGRRRATAVAERVRCGMLCVNDAVTNGAVAGLPFGGAGESGYGRVYGDAGLREMSWPRSVLVDRTGTGPEPAHYPLRRFGTRRALGLIGLLHGPGLGARLRGLWALATGR